MNTQVNCLRPSSQNIHIHAVLEEKQCSLTQMDKPVQLRPPLVLSLRSVVWPARGVARSAKTTIPGLQDTTRWFVDI